MAGISSDAGDLELQLPDIHDLFIHYSSLYFDDKLGAVSVEWSSKRMVLCGGTCQKVPGGAIIKLSEPLLKFRPVKDIKEVLLHEMIHAYIMVTNIKEDDPSGHGTAFKTIMQMINNSTVTDYQRPVPGGYNITVFHTMYEEVEYYRQHHWQCQKCSKVVKRSMNRPPQDADCRMRAKSAAACRDQACAFHGHIKRCGGEFVKIKEPEGFKAGGKPSAKRTKSSAASEGNGASGSGALLVGQKSITQFFSGGGNRLGSARDEQQPGGSNRSNTAVLPALQAIQNTAAAQQQQQQQLPVATTMSGQGKRELLAEAAMRRQNITDPQQLPPSNAADLVEEIDLVSPPTNKHQGSNNVVSCPICERTWAASVITNTELNEHVDACLITTTTATIL